MASACSSASARICSTRGPEMPERDLGAESGLAAGLGGLLLQVFDLLAHRLNLRVRLLALAGQRRDLVLGPGDVPLDLLLLVTPQGGLEAGLGGRTPTETEDLTAVRHAVHPHIRHLVPPVVGYRTTQPGRTGVSGTARVILVRRQDVVFAATGLSPASDFSAPPDRWCRRVRRFRRRHEAGEAGQHLTELGGDRVLLPGQVLDLAPRRLAWSAPPRCGPHRAADRPRRAPR